VSNWVRQKTLVSFYVTLHEGINTNITVNLTERNLKLYAKVRT